MLNEWRRRPRLLVPAAPEDWNRLRDAKQFLLVGKRDQAWMILSSLIQSSSLRTVTDTLDAVHIYLQRENQWREAIAYAAAHRAASVQLYRTMRADSLADIAFLNGYTHEEWERQPIEQILDSKRLELADAEKWLIDLCDAGRINALAEALVKSTGSSLRARPVAAFICDALERGADWRDVLLDARVVFPG